jgi:hypothetical protein
VSKQAIFYRIKKPPLSNALQSLTTKENGVLMVHNDGITLIKEAFKCETVKQFGDKKPSKENTSFDGELIKILQENILVLQQQLETKDKQMETKDRQIEELTATIRIQAESINADRKNELVETIIDGKDKLIGGNKQTKQNLFSKIFSRGNK